MKSKQLISRDIELFYTKASEETRLDKGMGVFEFERVKSLLSRYLAAGRLTILDVGGGTGKYAAWLADKGHEVHLVEPVPKHLMLAQHRANGLKNKFTVHAGEARALQFKNNVADVVILHGPLYHLQRERDRLATIGEAKRVLKRNGVLLAFGINYTASTLVGLLQGLIHKPSFYDMCMDELATGLHNPPDDFPWLLAEGYYHNPVQLRSELVGQGLGFLGMYAVEGMVWLDKGFFASMADARRKERLLALLELTECDPNLMALSPHIMVAAQKQHNYGR